MTILDAVVAAATKEVVSEVASTVADFVYKCTPKNAADDQRLEDLKHVAELGGYHD